MLLGLIHNLALLITLVVAYHHIARWLPRGSLSFAILSGLLFGVIGMLVMLTPVVFVPGVIYDARTIVLCLAGMFGGPLPATIAATLCVVYRQILGGAGAWVGTAMVVEAAAIGIALHHLRRNDQAWDRLPRLLLAGVVVHVIMLVIQLALPDDIGIEALRVIGPVVLVCFPLTFLLAAQIFLDSERRLSDTLRIARSEEHYRGLFDQNHAAMLLIDPASGSIIDTNLAAERFYGWSRDELRRMNIDEINALSTEEVHREMAAARAAQQARFFFRHRLADGSQRDVEVFSGAVKVDGRDLLYSIVHDVSGRMQAERESRRHQAMLERTEAIAHVGSWEWEAETDVVTWSKELFRIFGLDPAAGAPPFAEHQSIYVAEDRERLIEALQRCVTDGTPWEMAVRAVRPDGEVRHCQVHGLQEQVGTNGGNRIVGSLHDITELKAAERAVVEGHALLENLARLVPGVIYQYQLFPDGRSAFPYASPGIWDIYEVTPAEVREDATPVFGRLHPDDVDRVAAGIFESARTLTTFYCEFRVMLPEQGLRWRRSQAQPMKLDDGSVLWHGIILDDTERRLAEIESEKLSDQLRQAQKMESVGRLAGGVAHDFNNMLGVILGHAELALSGEYADGPQREHLEEITSSAQRSANLTRQLLAFARKQAVNPRTLDLNATITSTIKMLSRLIGEDIELRWEPASQPASVYVDPAQVDQLLTNLCVNARDAIGQRTGCIVIRTGRVTFDEAQAAAHGGILPGDYVLLSVNDNGSGMSPETQAMIFEPFFTTKPQGKGTGLGLATVYGVVKQNEGVIEVESEPDVGTTFRIYLPAHTDAELPLDSPTADLETALDGDETVLIVEDESAILRLVQSMLERRGYHVLTAATPGQAMSIARECRGPIHLLITDVIMPEMNGRDLSTRLREIHPKLTTMFMSGYTADVIDHQGMLESGVNFIQKPFTAQELAARVREALLSSP